MSASVVLGCGAMREQKSPLERGRQNGRGGSGRLTVTGEPGAEWSATLPRDHSVDSLAGWALWQSAFKHQSVRIRISPSNSFAVGSEVGSGQIKDTPAASPSLPLGF